MIPINLHHCNIFSGNFLQDTFDMIRLYVQFTTSLNTFRLECNCCHWKGSCIRHGYYERSYLLTAGDLVGEGTKIRILRVKCKHCGRTHAILPEEIAPYLPFSTVFIFPVLHLYYEKKETVESICSRFQIAIPQLYRSAFRVSYLHTLKGFSGSGRRCFLSSSNSSEMTIPFL